MNEEVQAPVFDDAFRAQLAALLTWRRDVRRFRRDSLPDGLLDSLIASAALAPSVGNAQPWRFMHVTSAQTREAMASHVDDTSRSAALGYDHVRARAYRALKLHGLREAPAILAVFCDEAPTAGHGLGIATMPEMLRYSTVMAIHTLWLAARAHDVGVGWVSIVAPGTIADLLDVPEQWSLIAVLCLGYPEHASTEPELHSTGWQDRLPVVAIKR